MDLQDHFKAYVHDATPAGYARALFMCAKMARDDLVARGYAESTVYFVLMSALMRLFDRNGHNSKVMQAATPLLDELQHEAERPEHVLPH